MLEIFKNILIKIGQIDRRIIFLIVGLSILIPMLIPDYFRIPIYASQTSKDFYNLVENLDEDSTILITFEYGPATAAEIQPMVTSLLKQSFYKKHKLYLLALWPDGKMMSQEAIKYVKNLAINDSLNSKFSDVCSMVEYEDYINLGYKPGGEAVIKGITKDLTEKFKIDINSKNVNEQEIMNRVKDDSGIVKISEFDLIASFSAGSVGTEEWILYASDPEDIPIVSGVTSVQVTDLIPYVRSKQLNAILDGLPAAAEYESLVDDSLKGNGIELVLHGRGEGQNKMIPQSVVHLLIVLFIIFGNISYFLDKRKN